MTEKIERDGVTMVRFKWGQIFKTQWVCG